MPHGSNRHFHFIEPAGFVRRWLVISLLLLLGVAAAASGQAPAASRVYQEANRLWDSGDFDSALEEYLLLVQQFPEDSLAPKALLRIIDLRQSRDDTVGTRAALKQLLSNYARTEAAAEGFVKQAEFGLSSARDLADVEEARSTFRRVPLLYGIATYPQLDARAQARIRSGELGWLLGDLDSSIADFVAAIEDEPASRWTGRGRLQLGRSLLMSGQVTAALEILQRLVDSRPADGSKGGSITATAADRSEAGRLISLAHRHVIRPRAGQAHWLRAERFPAAGLNLREPIGVAAAEDGRVLIVDDRQSLVALVDANGQVSATQQIDSLGRPAWSDRGAAYVVADDQIVLPFDGQRMSFLQPRTGKEAQLKNLQAAIRGPFGDWFLLAKGWKSLLNFQSRRKGQELLASIKPDLVDIERDHLGRVYALDKKSKSVLRLGIDRRSRETRAQGTWKRPIALAIDPLGNLYVLDRGQRQVSMYDAHGKLQNTIGPNLGSGLELREPRDLAVDGSGRLYIADAKLPFIVRMD